MKRSPLFVIGILMCSMAVSGCMTLVVGAAAGAGGYVWVKGNYDAVTDESVEVIHNATLRAFSEMGYQVTYDKYDHFNGKVIAKAFDEREIHVTITGQTEEQSKVRIRCGVMGDRYLSGVVYSKIVENF